MDEYILGYFGGYDKELFSSDPVDYHSLMKKKYESINKKFKKEFTLLPQLINHDAAAVLIKNGKVIAAVEEERFNRMKHSSGTPVLAIRHCLQTAGIDINQVNWIGYGFNLSEEDLIKRFYEVSRYYGNGSLENIKDLAEVYWDDFKNHAHPDFAKQTFQKCFPEIKDLDQKFIWVDHHLAHAASTFYPSNFDKALVVCMDGLGEHNSTSCFIGEGRNLEKVESFGVSASLGLLYSRMTEFIGFLGHEEEYKVMGLAPYGNSTKYIKEFKELVIEKDAGLFEIPLNCMTFSNRNQYLTNLFGKKPRKENEELTQDHIDIAASLQARLVEIAMKYFERVQRMTQLDKVCFAGGVALNCSFNGMLQRKKIFKDIYVQPSSNDAGTALGAALQIYFSKNPKADSVHLPTQYLGPEYTDRQIEDALQEFTDKITFRKTESPSEEAALYIHKNKVIGWFQGRMEYGPRALGCRSILANPCNPNMKDIVNSMIKKREGFRPFAPSSTLEDAPEFFELEDGKAYPFMIMTVLVKDDKKHLLPAVTHADRTARLQTVNKEDNLLYWKLIKELGKLSGVSVVLNTSFNVKGEPIVCSPEDAVKSFLISGLHALFIGSWVVEPKIS